MSELWNSILANADLIAFSAIFYFAGRRDGRSSPTTPESQPNPR